MSTLSAHQVYSLFEHGLDEQQGTSAEKIQSAYDELYALYKREVENRRRLQKEFDELQIMMRHQQKMFAVVKQLYDEQVQAASTDAVTGLPNHRAVIGRIEGEIAQCQKLEDSCAVLFVDIDHFKYVNDTWGHLAGDAILQEVGNRLRSGIKEGDFVGRYGGEEFAIVLSDSDIQKVYEVGERLRSLIADKPCTWEIEDTQVIVSIPVTVSIGIAVYRIHGISRNALIGSSDRAMYKAKHTGRNRVCIADPEIPALPTSI